MSRRAKGGVFRPTYTDRHGKKRTGRVWHIRYNRNGERVRESSGSTDKGVAEELLARRIAEMRPGGPLPSELEQVTFEELWRVIDIGEAEIDRYKTKRREGGAAPATVNRELSALRRAFNLAERRSLVARVPTFELYPERNRREGFLEPADFEKFRKELPPRLQPVAEVLYITGWRKGETLSRDWRHVDFEHGWIRLEASETKEGMPRQFPLIPRLRAVLEAQRERREQVGRETGRKVEALFFYYEPAKNGTPAGTRIKSFRKAWETAARKASVRVVPHDMRRSAVRNLVRAGVPERVAMQYTGHLTRSVFERYNIVSEADLREQAGKLQTFLDASGR
jgi:integrase